MGFNHSATHIPNVVRVSLKSGQLLWTDHRHFWESLSEPRNRYNEEGREREGRDGKGSGKELGSRYGRSC